MKKHIKKILLAIAAIVVLLIAAVVIALIVIDPNNYRPQISEAVYKATGRQLELNGPIGLKIFPRLAISAQDVKLAAAEGFGDEPLLAFDELDLRMSIFPLLKGVLDVQSVGISGLKVALITDKQGRNSWDAPASASSADTAPATTSSPAPEAKPEVSATPSSAEQPDPEKHIHTLLESRISQISIANTKISYVNQGSGQNYELKLNELNLDNVGLDRDISCKLDIEAADNAASMRGGIVMNGIIKYMLREQEVTYNISSIRLSGDMPQLDGRQDINGKLQGNFSLADMKGKLGGQLTHAHADMKIDTTFALDPVIKADGKLDLAANPLGLMRMAKMEGLPPADSPLRSLNASSAFLYNDGLINMDNLELKLGGNDVVLRTPTLQAKLDSTGKSGLPLSNLDLSMELNAMLRPLMKMAGVEPANTGGSDLSTLNAGVAVKLAGQQLNINNLKVLVDKDLLEFSAPSINSRLDLSGKAPFPVTGLNGDISLKAKPRQLMTAMDIKLDTADPAVLRDLSAALKFSMNDYVLNIPAIQASLDQTTLGGNAEVRLPGAKSIPKGAMASTVVRLNMGTLDVDRYLPPAKEEAPAGKPAPSQGGGTSAPAEPAKGPLQDSVAARIYADLGLNVQKISVQGVDLDKIVLQVILDKGTVNVNKAQLNTLGGSVNAMVSAALAQPKPKVVLSGDVKGINIGTALETFADEKRIGGKGDVNLNFTFSGLDADSIIDTLTGKARLTIKDGTLRFALLPSVPELGKDVKSEYKFRDIEARFTAIDGKLVNDHVDMSAPGMDIKGVGSIDMKSKELSYTGKLTTKDVKDFPFIIEGPVSNLSARVDQEALVREAAQQAAQKAAQKAIQDLQDKGKLPASIGTPESKAAAQQKAQQKIEEEKQKAADKVNQELQKGIGKLFNK